MIVGYEKQKKANIAATAIIVGHDSEKQKKTPRVGIEPTTTRLRV